MSSEPETGTLRNQAAAILRSRFGTRSSLGDLSLVREGPRARVYRAPVSGIPSLSSVILKQILQDPARGFNDWAALHRLSAWPDAEGLAPRFYSGSEEARLILIEDLGGSSSLDTLLREANAKAAVSALERLAEQTARLHLAACGEEIEYNLLRRSLPGMEDIGREREAEGWLGARGKLYLWLEAAGCAVPDDFEGCLERIAALYAEPGWALTLTHGDMAPTNNHVRAGEVRLLDFEYAAYRHALYDLTAWYVLCPLPLPLVERMATRYRARTGYLFPDEASFREGWAFMTAYRALAMLTWIGPEVLEADRPWVEEWTACEAVLTALSRLRAAAAPCSPLHAAAEAAGALHASLRALRPEFKEESLPRWPAFR